ncbi:MAG TPA: FtsX-like permease family protein, partial [Niastella sp.]
PWAKDWTNGGPRTRIQLRSDADRKQFEAKLEWFLKGRNTDFNSSFYIQLFLQPETEAYLHASFKNGYRQGGRIVYVRLLTIVAIFLLLIAGINFTNLATARSVKRAREVGVRKVAGAGRISLVWQFMGEAILLAAIALIIAVIIVVSLLPAFNQLTGKHLAFSLANAPAWAALLLGLLIITGFLAGSYPAFFLSSLNPARVLKGQLRFGARAQLFRQGLVVFQFLMSMLLITGTLIVYRQLNYIETKDIGYDRKNLITIPGHGMSKQYEAFSNALLQLPGIQAVTHAALNPLGNGNTTESVLWPGKDPNDMTSFNQTSVWYDFAKVLKVNILQGRDFSPAFADSNNYLVNQMAAARMGYKDPVGKPLTFWRKPGKIIGVIEDFHFNSLYQPITPMIIRLDHRNSFDNILVRIEPGKTKEALTGIEKVYHTMNPDEPFTFTFIDEGYQLQYKNETIVRTLATIFTFLAIFIACLGLFGLAAFTAEQRTKEIGVRKVLGASVANIVRLLSKDFLKLVLIAIVIATPVAWWVMQQWLQGFAYRVKISWWIFALAGLLAVVIALITISFQSIKAALMSPAKSLKTE